MMRNLLVNIIGLFLALNLTACSGEKITHVILQTQLGDIEIEVYKSRTSLSAENFLYYVDNDLYDGQGFYRAVRSDTDPCGTQENVAKPRTTPDEAGLGRTVLKNKGFFLVLAPRWKSLANFSCAEN